MTDTRPDTVIARTAYRPASVSAPPPWHVRQRGRLVAAGVALVVLAVATFLLTGRAVRIEFSPADASLAIEGGISFTLGGTWILRPGEYRVTVTAPGYEPLESPLVVGPEDNQSARFELVPLPGVVRVETAPDGAEIRIDGVLVGTTPQTALRVAAGAHTLELVHPLYRAYRAPLEVEGREIEQSVSVTLEPNWAAVEFSSEPSGAQVFVDDVEVGTTPARIDVVAGSRAIRLKHAGFKTWHSNVEVVAGQDQVLATATLEAADALLTVTSSPPAAGVTVDGRYAGLTPIEVGLAPGRSHRVRLTKAGFESVVRPVQLARAEERTLVVSLTPLIGSVLFTPEPADAQVLVDGGAITARKLDLPARPHTVEIRKPGYVAYRAEIIPQPGLTQEVKVKLLTEAEARLASMPPRMRHPAGGEMLLLSGGTVQMGASRREPGRRANEVQREARVTRLFYLGTREITNGEFRKFASGHSSGKFEDQELDKDDQPVVNVSWEDAARFCNWLSKQAKLPEFYRFDLGKVVGVDSRATGYRLPTEAEWAWATRTAPDRPQSQRFPWGDQFPPPDRHGNYADRSAAHLVGRVIFGYNDNYVVTAPVGSFAPDARGLYDLSGNVAEWVSDFYQIPSADPVTDPLGPETGEYRVIRGSSWMSGTVTDLRGAFRDYGVDGRPDLGFRVARFAE